MGDGAKGQGDREMKERWERLMSDESDERVMREGGVRREDGRGGGGGGEGQSEMCGLER